jgi:autotransporter-associated beta strand protein
MQGSSIDDTAQTLQFSGVVSGGSTASLSISGLNSDQNLGRILLTGANAYAGGSIINGGRLEVSGSTATFGVGNIVIHNPANVMTNPVGQAAAISRLVIPNGVANAISDTATLTIESGNRAFVNLGSLIDETVGKLVLGGTTYTAAGTYGSMTSLAENKFSDFFSGTGVIRLLDTGIDGDHNGDGVVDAADYAAWRKTDGGNQAGYDDYVENFNEMEAGSGSGLVGGAVPEPAMLSLLFGLVAPIALARREIGCLSEFLRIPLPISPPGFPSGPSGSRAGQHVATHWAPSAVARRAAASAHRLRPASEFAATRARRLLGRSGKARGWPAWRERALRA